jgi:hypothetical protein
MEAAAEAIVVARLRRIERRTVRFTNGARQQFACEQLNTGQHEEAQCNDARNCGPTDHLYQSSHNRRNRYPNHMLRGAAR